MFILIRSFDNKDRGRFGGTYEPWERSGSSILAWAAFLELTALDNVSSGGSDAKKTVARATRFAARRGKAQCNCLARNLASETNDLHTSELSKTLGALDCG